MKELLVVCYSQIKRWLLGIDETNQISVSEQNTIINSIKFYYEQTLGKDRTYYDIPRPNKPFQLPNVLSEEEVIKLIKF